MAMENLSDPEDRTLSPAVALVTGAAGRIGRSLVRGLLERGLAVAALDRDEDALAELRENTDEQHRLLALGCDISNEEDVRVAVATTEKALGPIEALINNAAHADPINAPLDRMELSAWRAVMASNLEGLFLCCKHALPSLRSTRGAVVNMASTRALMSEPHSEAYAASKGAMVAFTHALAISEGPLVRVNCISPGWIVPSDDPRFTLPDLGERDHTQHPVGRVGDPADIVGMCWFLISRESGFITGQNFVVDGGMTKKMIYAE